MRPVVTYSLKQVVFINVIFVLLIVAGLFSLFTAPVENMPSIDLGRVFITTVYYGASAEDVEKLVTSEIEDAIDGLENVEYVQSRSLRNYSSIEVKFIDDTDYASLYDELRFRVLNIKNELPPEADEPTFMYLDTQAWIPVIVVNLLGEIPNGSLKLLAEELKTEIINIPDVRDVGLLGEYTKEFHISLDPEKLRAFGITFDQAAKAVGSANTKAPAGRFSEGGSAFMLDAGDVLSSQKEVLNVILRRDGDGNFIRVKDVASNAMMSHRDPDVIASTNGVNTVRLLVKKEETGNSIKIVEAVKELCEKFEETHRIDNIKTEITWDSTIEINDSIRVLSGNMILGMVLISLILWAVLGFRNAMLTAIGIPFSFLCALIIIKVTGLSINTISLFSFVLVSGIIVDDAVIILENVYRHMQLGKPRKEAVVDGVSEVMLPVISTALTTILAFIPMLIMTGNTGEFFSVIPKTVTFALAASLLEALFILPVHILDWGSKEVPHSAATKNAFEDPLHHLRTGLFAPFWNIYRKVLDVLFAHKAMTLGLMFMVFISAVIILVLSVAGIMPLVKVKFFPGSYFRYHIAVTMPRGVSVERTDAVVRDISRFVVSLGKAQAKAVAGNAGLYEDEDYSIHNGHHYGQVVVTLPEQKERNFPENPDNDLMRHLDFMRDELNAYIAEKYDEGASRPTIKIFPENTGPPAGKAVNVRVSGNSMDEALKAADAIMDYLESAGEFSDLVDLTDNRAEFQKVVKYIPKQENIFEHGLSSGAVTSLVASALNGSYAGGYRTGGEEVDLVVRLARVDDKGNIGNVGLSGPLDLLDIPVIEHSSSPVFIRDLVNMKYTHEPDLLARYNRKPTVTITSDIRAGSEMSAGRVQFLVKKFFANIAAEHPGVTLSFGGEFESTSRAYTSLTFAFCLAVLAIYLVLASQFKDYLQPMIIISSVTFAVIGVVYGMFVTRSTFTVGSFLAVVGLAGIAVNDSLILIDFINVGRRKGKPLRDAVIEGCAARMRPVLITTVTTMLGLLPMAIGIPHKSVAWAPMATAFVTGLSSATILTLLIIPVEYEFAEKAKLFLRRALTREGKDASEAEA